MNDRIIANAEPKTQKPPVLHFHFSLWRFFMPAFIAFSMLSTLMLILTSFSSCFFALGMFFYELIKYIKI